MTNTLESPLGPIDFVPRDFSRWPRNSKPPTIDPSRLRGLTAHYAGGAIGGYYAGNSLQEGDEELIGATIRSHNARPGLSDVGYQTLLGRTGKLYDGRGLASMNGANGPLLTAIKTQYPTGTTTSNPFFCSVFVCVGTDAGFTTMTPAQRETLARLWSLVVQFFGLKTPILNGHRDVRATSCPGDSIHGELAAVAKRWPLAPTCQISNPAHPEWSCWPKNASKPTIGPGSSGDAVAYLHGVLRFYGYSVSTGGVWATATTKAVGLVQKSNGLRVEPAVGPATWKIIDTMAMRAK